MLLLAIHSQKQQEWSFSSVTVASQSGECRLKSPTRMVGSVERVFEVRNSDAE